MAWYATGRGVLKLHNISFDTNSDEVYIIADTHYGSADGVESNLGKIKVTVKIDKEDNYCHISKIDNN